VSFATITLCVASEQVFIVVYFVMTQSRNFWIYPHIDQFISLLTSVSDAGTGNVLQMLEFHSVLIWLMTQEDFVTFITQ
jgi:hypothetical protein